MRVKEVVDYLHSLAPNQYQEEYDNSGLLVGSYDDTITGALVSLDVTEAVLDEGITLGCNLIISHHPIIFSGIKRLTDADYIQRIVKKAIKNDLNLFAIHTNLDNVYEYGVNTNIAKLLGLSDIKILRPKAGLDDLNVGSGVIGSIKEQDEEAFLTFLKKTMNISCIKYTNLRNIPIQKVAICGGSGRFLLPDAIRAGADIFISSDFKYHEFFDADGQIVIADIGHFESEQFTTHMLWEILTNKFSSFAAHYTKVNTNPVNYLKGFYQKQGYGKKESSIDHSRRKT